MSGAPLGFLGTGLLGAPMARRFRERGLRVIAWNRTPAKAEALRDAGIEVAHSVAEVLEQCTTLAAALADADALRACLLGPDARMRLRGRTVIQLGTIGPEECLALAAEVARAGGELFEAPVLGSINEARAGRLEVMVGGSPEQLARFRGLLEHLGPVAHVGPVGQAAALKLALNGLIATLTAAFGTSLAAVRARGIDVGLFMDILRRSALYAPTFDKKLPRLVAGDFANPNFPVRHMLKDVDLVLHELLARRIEPALVAAVRGLLVHTIAAGRGEEDYSSLTTALGPAPGGPD